DRRAELGRFKETAVRGGQGGEERVARLFVILPSHRLRHVDAVRVQRLKPAVAAPERERGRVVEKLEQDRLVIAAQRAQRRRKATCRQTLDDGGRMGPAIDVVAEKERDDLARRACAV